jgi:hypothetical protein
VTTTGRETLARQLRNSVLAYLGDHPGWVPNTDLLRFAPEEREIVIRELEGEESFRTDWADGGVYDTGPAGRPDGGMLANVTNGLRRELLVDMRVPLAYRLYEPDEPVGLEEITERLGVQRGTADKWRQRGVLPAPTWPAVGGRPAWRWAVIRDWAFATGRNPDGPNAPRWRWTPEGGEVVVDEACR